MESQAQKWEVCSLLWFVSGLHSSSLIPMSCEATLRLTWSSSHLLPRLLPSRLFISTLLTGQSRFSSVASHHPTIKKHHSLTKTYNILNLSRAYFLQSNPSLPTISGSEAPLKMTQHHSQEIVFVTMCCQFVQHNDLALVAGN